MARKRQKLDQHNQSAEVHRRLKTEPSGVVRERLLAVSLGIKGELTLGEIADNLNRSRATIQTWFDNYRDKGIEGLYPSKSPRGFASALQGRARKELMVKLSKGSFRRAEDAQQWLERRHGIKFSLGHTRHLLGKLEARLKVVRPRHPNSSEKKREEFRTQLARKMFHALKSRHGSCTQWKRRKLRIWIADEARFGLQPNLKRAWASRAIRIHKSSRIRYQWRYFWGAVEVDGTGSEYLYTEGANTEFSVKFLEQISRNDPSSEHVVIWDGAGFHPDHKHEGFPSNVTVLRQPPYSPELNCVEKLWDQLRDGLCNRNWNGIDQLLEQATRWLRGFWRSPSKIRSLVGEGWLLHQSNA